MFYNCNLSTWFYFAMITSIYQFIQSSYDYLSIFLFSISEILTIQRIQSAAEDFVSFAFPVSHGDECIPEKVKK